MQDWDGENFGTYSEPIGTYSELLGISSDYFRMHRPSVAIRGPLTDGSCTAYHRAIMRNQEAARPVCGHPWPSMDGAVDLGTYHRATMRNQVTARPVRGILHGWSRRSCKIGTGEISEHTPNRLEHTPNCLEYPPIYPAIAPTISGCTARLWPSVAL